MLIVTHSPPVHREVARLIGLLAAGENPPADEVLLAKFDRRVRDLRFNSIRMADALAFLRDLRWLNAAIDAASFEKAGVSSDAEISLRLWDVPFRATVEEVLAASAGKAGVLDWGVRDNVVEIRSADAFAANPILRVYDGREFPYIGNNMDKWDEAWIKLITTVAEPDSWTATGGRLDWFGLSLIVRQSPKAHRQIAWPAQRTGAARRHAGCRCQCAGTAAQAGPGGEVQRSQPGGLHSLHP